eukprot:6190288-Pleurochrysis_carterae.AAC.2
MATRSSHETLRPKRATAEVNVSSCRAKPATFRKWSDCPHHSSPRPTELSSPACASSTLQR